jgi:hypothetical protein
VLSGAFNYAANMRIFDIPGHEARTTTENQKMKIKPHDLFELWTGDEVAECWPGVPDDLYLTIWNVIVPAMEADPDQQPGETPEVGVAALVHYWHLLSESDQERLNTTLLALAF